MARKIKLNILDVGRLMDDSGKDLYKVLRSLKETATEKSKVKSLDIWDEYEFELEEKKIRAGGVIELTYRYL